MRPKTAAKVKPIYEKAASLNVTIIFPKTQQPALTVTVTCAQTAAVPKRKLWKSQKMKRGGSMYVPHLYKNCKIQYKSTKVADLSFQTPAFAAKFLT